MNLVATLYEDREHGIMLIVISSGILLERVESEVWKPTERKGVTIPAIQRNLHGFFVRKRDLGPSETMYKEIESYLA